MRLRDVGPPREAEVRVLISHRLKQRQFADWNYLVRGLISLWDRVRLNGREAELERLLAEDTTGAVTELLARLGNDWQALEALLEGEASVQPLLPPLTPAGLPSLDAEAPVVE